VLVERLKAKGYIDMVKTKG